jgi:hypothetical protein
MTIYIFFFSRNLKQQRFKMVLVKDVTNSESTNQQQSSSSSDENSSSSNRPTFQVCFKTCKTSPKTKFSLLILKAIHKK